jgi:hypothetical protein
MSTIKYIKDHLQYHSFETVRMATFKIHRELMAVGLAHAGCRLREVNVHWMKLPSLKYYRAFGFFFHGEPFEYNIFNYQRGHIYYPSTVLKTTKSDNRCHPLDVLRHEFGHAFAHYYYDELFSDNEGFEKAFGGAYFDSVRSRELPIFSFISDYAQESPMEDFAETFMVYLRRRGEIPYRFQNPDFKKKWKFIASAIRASINLSSSN